MFEDYPDILSPEEAAEALRIGENAIYEPHQTERA